MATILGEAFVVIRTRLSGLHRGLALAKRAVSRAMGSIIKWTKRAAIALLALSAVIVKIGATFEKTMSRVLALTGATADGFKRLQESAREMGRTTVFAATQAAEAMSFFALAGFKVTEIIKSMPSVLSLAASGSLSIASAANIAANVMAGMGIKAKDLGNAVDILTAAFTSAKTDLPQLGQAMKFVGPVARLSKISFEKLTASLQAMSKAGFQGGLAGTSLRTIISRLAGAVPSVTKEIKKLGIVTVDSSGKMKPLADIIDDMNDSLNKLGGAAAKQAKVMQLFGLRGGPGMAGLLEQGGDAIREYEQALLNSGGTAQRIADIMLDNLAGSYTLLKSAMSGVAEQLSTNLNPTLRKHIDGLRKWLNENRPAIEKWAATISTKVNDNIEKFKEWLEYLNGDWRKGIREAMDVITNKLVELTATITPHAIKLGIAIGEGILIGVGQTLKSLNRKISEAVPGARAFEKGQERAVDFLFDFGARVNQQRKNAGFGTLNFGDALKSVPGGPVAVLTSLAPSDAQRRQSELDRQVGSMGGNR